MGHPIFTQNKLDFTFLALSYCVKRRQNRIEIAAA